jgi:hypothetical protein
VLHQAVRAVSKNRPKYPKLDIPFGSELELGNFLILHTVQGDGMLFAWEAYCTGGLLHWKLIAREAYYTGGLLHGRLIAREAYCTGGLLHGCFLTGVF